MLPPVIGSVVALTMASYFWYRFEQISDSPSPIIAKIKKLHIPGRKLAGVAGAMLALYQIYAQSVGIQQNFWIALIACLGIGATIVYVRYPVPVDWERWERVCQSCSCALSYLL